MKLLIVDDQISVAQGLLHCTDWAGEGFDCVETAYNVIDAKTSLLRREAQVMLCDIEMPVESGLDLLKWARENQMRTRCIFLTAHAEFRYAQEAVRLGGFDYIMQPAPYAQVIETVRRAVQDVHMEYAAQELQDRGALFDGQQKVIADNLLRSCLAGTATERDREAFDALGLHPKRDRACWLCLLQPLRWNSGTQPWSPALLSTAVDNMCGEIFAPLNVFSRCLPMPHEQGIALILQSLADELLATDTLTGRLTYLQSACTQYLHLETALYLAGPEPFAQAAGMWKRLADQRRENVALKSGIFRASQQEPEAPEAFRFAQIAGWRRLIRDGYASAVEKEACQLLDQMAAADRLSRTALRAFYQQFMEMVLSLQEDSADLAQQALRDPAVRELLRSDVHTVDDMKSLLHALACAWENGTEAKGQDIAEMVCRYIAEHLENELRRDELAEAVHLNPDYMARLFKKETGVNLKDYIIQQKMQEARSLLHTTNLPVSLIAAKVGYSNFAHFSASYKKMYNRSPQEERSNQ